LEPAAEGVFKNLEALVLELRPAVDRVVEAFEEDGLEGALAQVAIEWNKIYEESLKPLWIRFLTFLDETIKPLAIELGKEIGAAIAEGISTAALEALSAPGSALGQGALDAIEGLFGPPKPPPQFRQPGESVSDFIDRQRQEAGLPPLPPPRPPTPPRPTTGRTFDPLRYDFGAEKLAAGGFVTSPTFAMVGEAGPEVVMPLEYFESRYGGGGGTTVNVTVTSADPQAVVEELRRYTRTNGPLGQVVSV
jgi:hypothetical protein